ncbi:MAG: Hsp20/alpha crystallin family protein [Clostridia bacterium]|nr:Hsp20/alpha crystallin family protein [Clostridia bacterium]
MKNSLQKKTTPYDLFDAFDDFFMPAFYDEPNALRTNIREGETSYELELEMPGYDKDQIKLSLENGYITVSAKKEVKEESKDKHYIRREISESCQRSYYVGTDVTEKDIKARYNNGILSLEVPKAAPKADTSHQITID